MTTNKPTQQFTRAEVQRMVAAAVAKATKPLLEQLEANKAQLAEFAESSPLLAKLVAPTETTRDGQPILKVWTSRASRNAAANTPRVAELRAEVDRLRGLVESTTNSPTLALGYRQKLRDAEAELGRLTNRKR